MSVLWGVAGLMIVVTLIVLLGPLIRRRRRDAAPARTEYDVAVFREQLVEVEKDIERGLLSDEQGVQARTEIKRRLLAAAGDDVEDVSHKPGGNTFGSLALVAVLAFGIPAGALGLYTSIGNPTAPDLPLAERRDKAMEQARQKARMSEMLAKLEAKLQETPNDLKGWRLLGQSYMNVDRFTDAANAFRHVVEVSNRAPDALAAYAEALVIANEGTIIPTAKTLFAEAVQKDPDDVRGVYYLGLAKAQAGDVQGALDDWNALVARAPADATWLGAIKQQIDVASRRLGGTPAIAGDGAGPSRADMEAAAEMSSDDRQDMIRAMVQRLADKLEANPNDAEGWQRLVRAYQVLGDTAKAQEAQAKLDALK